jgi:fucose 4-O-acetylase-like acetyltransferase
LGIAGATGAGIAYAAAWLPTPYPRSDFWTTSPAFFLLRVGVMVTTIALAYAWEARPRLTRLPSPMEQLGRTSLFIYWIHVEMVYGLISLRIHHALTLQQAWLALVAFTGFMLVCSVAKDRTVARWRAYRTGSQTAALAPP